jgi:hypothetical protein
MTAVLTEADRAFYETQGYLIFRQILPVNLIADLRRTAAKAREVARELHGPKAQRLAELERLDASDLAPLQAFAELPNLNAALHALLSPQHRISYPGGLSFLFEPAQHCWGLAWHRDWRDHMSAAQAGEVFGDRWEAMASDPKLFNQINCALYEDPCTWFVPGSHRQLQDTPGQVRAAKASDDATLANRRGEHAEEEHERFLFNYCAGMPGGQPLILQAGDLVIYRSIAWHTGSYLPYRKRATLHCSAATPEYERFWADTKAVLAK